MARILLVEDDAVLAKMIRTGPSLARDEILVCNDGRSAVELAARNPPDLVLLDVDGPYVDGFEVCRRIRELETGDHRATIVVVTPRDEPSSKLLGFSCGMDDYLVKPVDARELCLRVTLWIDYRAQQADLVMRRRRDAIQEVVAAISHQVNNPLAVALMGLDLVLERGHLPAESVRELEMVRDHLLRISRVLRHMRVGRDDTVPYFGGRRMIDVKPLE